MAEIPKLIRLFTTKTARSAITFYLGSFVVSFGRYLFHLVLLRIFIPSEYGEFMSYLSLIYLLGVPTTTLASATIKYVSEFYGKKDYLSINLLFHHLVKSVTPIAFSVSIFLIIFSNSLAALLKSNQFALVILGISFSISFYQTIISSYIAAFQQFALQIVSGMVGVVSSIIIAFMLIRLGYGPVGAVLGQLLGGLITSLIIFSHIAPLVYPKQRNKSHTHPKITGLMGYSFAYALGTMSLISVDVLVVRSIFDTHLSGIYSSLSVLGRVIIFGLTPFISLVLPLASHRKAAVGSSKTVFIKLGTGLLLFGLSGVAIFSFFPELVIKLLSGSSYIEITKFLPLYSLTMVLFSLSQFIVSYLMAINRPKANLILLMSSVAQPLVFYFFRRSFPLVIAANFGLHLILFGSLLLYLLVTRNSLPTRL